MNRLTGLALAILCVASVASSCRFGVGVNPCVPKNFSLQFDEAVSWRVARAPIGSICAEAAKDNHPPIFYMLLKVWIWLLGDSVGALRCLSGVCGVATVVGVFLLVIEGERATRSVPSRDKRLGSVCIATIAGILVSLSPAQCRFAWDVRMYALGAALGVWSSWALLRALRRKCLAEWVVYCALSTAFVYTHYIAVFSILSHYLFAVSGIAPNLRTERSFTRSLGLVASISTPWIIIALSFAPWLPVLVARHATVQSSFWVGNVTLVAGCETLYNLSCSPDDTTGAWWTVCVVSGLVAATTAVLIATVRDDFDYFLLLSYSVPVVLCLAVSIMDTGLFFYRYLIFAHVFWLTSLAVAIGRARPAVAISVAVVCCTVFLLLYCRMVQRMDNPLRPGSAGACAYLSSSRLPGEKIVAGSLLAYFPVDYYFRDDPHVLVLNRKDALFEFQGAGLLKSAELIEPRHMAETGKIVWVIDYVASKAVTIPSGHMPRNLDVLSERRFAEMSFDGDIVVRKYLSR